MRVIIICAGDGTRWGDYLGVPKHLAEVDGEPILHRTVRLFSKEDTEIYVVSKDDDRYKVDGSTQYIPTFNLDNFDADKFLNSKELWSEDDRTVVVYGDVYFTEEAVKKILSWESREWTLFARPFGSSITGTPYGECFAQSFYPESIAEHTAALRRIVSLYEKGILPRCGGWEHYRAILRLPGEVMHRHLVGEKLQVIDDLTDDVDYSEDYLRLIKAKEDYGL